LVSGGPLGSGHLTVNPHNGHVYLAGDPGGGADSYFYRYIPGTGWRAQDTVQGKTVAPSPHNASHIMLFNAGSYLKVSVDGGDTFAPEGGRITHTQGQKHQVARSHKRKLHEQRHLLCRSVHPEPLV
jgi:hypothetical protein